MRVLQARLCYMSSDFMPVFTSAAYAWFHGAVLCQEIQNFTPAPPASAYLPPSQSCKHNVHLNLASFGEEAQSLANEQAETNLHGTRSQGHPF